MYPALQLLLKGLAPISCHKDFLGFLEDLVHALLRTGDLDKIYYSEILFSKYLLSTLYVLSQLRQSFQVMGYGSEQNR